MLEGGADLSIGSRYVKGVNVVNWPLGRVLMSYFALSMSVVTGMKVNDATVGFVCYRAAVLRTISIWIRYTPKGMPFR